MYYAIQDIHNYTMPNYHIHIIEYHGNICYYLDKDMGEDDIYEQV